MRVAGFFVHILTASGAGLALLALIAAVRSDWPLMFAWLGVALVVDGIDGPLARLLRVSERLPRWSGVTLDLVVDYVTYVFIPAYVIADAGMLPPPVAAMAAARGALQALEALDAEGRITPHGRAMARLPMEPALAHMLLFAAERGQAEEAAQLTLLLQERGLGGRGEDLE